MIWLSRAMLVFVYSLYWGGLTFYTGFVVRISHDVLSDPMDGGLITQRVTALLQVLGVVSAAMMIINAAIVSRRAKSYGVALAVCVAVLCLALVGLFIVHAQLDAVIDVAQVEISDRESFTIGHRRYNQLTTVQWLACVTYLPLTIAAWRRIDSSRRESTAKS